jgi:recombination protein RecR
MPDDDAQRLARAIEDVKRNTRSCSVCANVTETDPCAVCADARRDRSTVLVVEQPRDVVAFEEAAAFGGVYHVLGGRVSPLDGVSADDLTLSRLVERVRSGDVAEVVIATGADLEGDGTALYVERALAGADVKITRIARGIPSGHSIQNSSTAMLQDAIRGRQTTARPSWRVNSLQKTRHCCEALRAGATLASVARA